MDLYKFYAVSEENDTPENEFTMKYLGEKTHRMTISKRVRKSYGFASVSDSLYTETTNDDYDNEFCEMILNINPPYEVDKLLEYYFRHYTKVKKGDKKLFYNHLRYVILPKLQKREGKQIYVEFVTKWLEGKETPKWINFNILELKPNIMGVGINLNEMINSMFK